MRYIKVVTLFAFMVSVTSWASGSLGGDMPIPFKSANQKVELADGEVYYLGGKVFITEGIAYLQIDLSQHSWLANTKRKEFPYYRLEGSVSYWQKYEGKTIRVNVEANAKILQYGRQFVYELSLIPLSDPGIKSESPRR